MILNCVIVDDEPLAREILNRFIEEMPDLKLSGSFSNAEDALNFLNQFPVDILFLDIEMPNINGIQLLQKLNDPPITVFTTAFRNYAYEGFELGVIDFLLKPFSRNRFVQAVEKIKEFISLQQKEIRLHKNTRLPEFIFIKSGVEKIKLILDDVIFIQGLKDYAIIQSEYSRTVVKGSVKYMQELFPEPDFVRVHKSFIVSKSRIRRIVRNRILIGDHIIPIGRTYRELFP